MNHFSLSNAIVFDTYEQEYADKTYTLFTDNSNTEYHLFSQLQSEYNTVAAYSDSGWRSDQSISTVRHLNFSERPYQVRFEKHRIDRTSLCRASGDTHRLLPAERSVHGHQLCIHRPYSVGVYAPA